MPDLEPVRAEDLNHSHVGRTLANLGTVTSIGRSGDWALISVGMSHYAFQSDTTVYLLPKEGDDE